MVDLIADSSQQEPGDDCYSVAEQHFVTVPAGYDHNNLEVVLPTGN